MTKPTAKPQCPNFSSGPCAKRPGYGLDKLDTITLGRSHRSALGKSALQRACVDTATILGLPEGYRVGIVPGSDTGAMEMAMWSLLGYEGRGVDVLQWETFGKGWLVDITKELKLQNVTAHNADYGHLPDLAKVNFENDVVFPWNGTTAGVKVPNGNWIPADRAGLTICDATSAVFAMDMPWEKLDVVTYSWQKVLGGEGAHGVIILSPRAVERLELYVPSWPLPKIFRMTTAAPATDGSNKKNKLVEGIFKGDTINTPSMLAVADYLDALDWVRSIGGVSQTIARSNANLEVMKAFVAANDWIEFLAKEAVTVSNTSVCFTLKATPEQVAQMVKLLDKEGVAHDIGAYRDAPAGLRIWCGATVVEEDLKLLLPWLQWAYTACTGALV